MFDDITPDRISYYIPSMNVHWKFMIMVNYNGTWYMENRKEIAEKCCHIMGWDITNLVDWD